MDDLLAFLFDIGSTFDELILVLNNDKEICYLNEAAKLQFGLDAESIQLNFNTYCAKYKLPLSSKPANSQSESTFKHRQCKIISHHRNNLTVIINWKIINIDKITGHPLILLTGKNISNEIYSNEKIDDLEIQLNNMMEVMVGNYWWKDTRGVYKGFNQSLLNLLGVQQEEIIGKTDFDLPWADTAKQLAKNDRFVIESGQPCRTEEEIKSFEGEVRIFDIFKAPLKNNKGEVIGVMGNSIDITEQKKIAAELEEIKRAENARLKNELQHQKILIEEKERFVMLANKLAHDINSPLASLNIMLTMCSELPETKRSIMKSAVNAILDIANNLLAAYRNQENQPAPADEHREALLLSDLLVQLLSEKKVQYSDRPVKFKIDIDSSAQFSFANLQSSQFRRAMSNLIDNAVDALDQKSEGIITVKLITNNDLIVVSVQDTGKGMTLSMIEKILNRKCASEGQERSLGIGLQQVWDTIDHNEGVMTVNSIPDQGTTIQITFPLTDCADWIAGQIQIAHDSIIVILDDDESIHGAWDARLNPFLEMYSTLRSHHFTHGAEVINFVDKLNSEEKHRVLFLSDFELAGQTKNGLEIIELVNIKNAFLITSYYTDLKIRDKATQLGIKILPKKMASIVPIKFDLST